MLRQYELVERVKGYNPTADEDMLNRAYVFAMKQHGNQLRASGDPYFSHPVEVAGLLSEKKLDVASIVTGLLHDTVEDTDTTVEEVSALFSKDIGHLVDGVTKLSLIKMKPSGQSYQSENFRKFVLAMSRDIRVLLVKLADRLHNMRTLHHISKPEKRRRIARETMELYAPLAERMGIRDWKEELEDLAFKHLFPDARKAIISRLEEQAITDQSLVGRIIDKIQSYLKDQGIESKVSGRRKTAYSIWRKMRKRNVSFAQLSDIMAFRVAVNTKAECYNALGLLHNAFTVIPGFFKDYISLPKPNGYQSLHTIVLGPENQRIEIQIRTNEMHETAELGVAAHWHYKQAGHSQGQDGKSEHEGTQYRWLRDILDILDDAETPDEFLENTKMEMFRDRVFVMSPQGDLFSLPEKATVVDFAYAVHSDVGNHCASAKVNGRHCSLKTVLNNGDQVEVVTQKNQKPSVSWEQFVVTGKARAAIRRYIRANRRDEFKILGQSMLETAFKQADVSLSEKAIKEHLSTWQQESLEDVYVRVGEGFILPRDIMSVLYPDLKLDRGPKAPLSNELIAKGHARSLETEKKAKNKALPFTGLISGMAVHYAGCCHPLPGDAIVGVVATGKGVTIHKKMCDNLKNFEQTPERLLDIDWNITEDSDKPFVGRLHIILSNVPGSLAAILSVISASHGNIRDLKVTHRTHEYHDILLDVDVKSVEQLEQIMANLRSRSIVFTVERG